MFYQEFILSYDLVFLEFLWCSILIKDLKYNSEKRIKGNNFNYSVKSLIKMCVKGKVSNIKIPLILKNICSN